jgi:hypothetical protein
MKPSYFLLPYSNTLNNSFPYHFSIPFKYFFKSMLGERERKERNFLNKIRIREAKVLPKFWVAL